MNNEVTYNLMGFGDFYNINKREGYNYYITKVFVRNPHIILDSIALLSGMYIKNIYDATYYDFDGNKPNEQCENVLKTVQFISFTSSVGINIALDDILQVEIMNKDTEETISLKPSHIESDKITGIVIPSIKSYDNSSKSNQQKKKKTVKKDFKEEYCKEINALITMLWKDYRHTPQLHHMKQKWELWLFYYNCLKKAKGINTYEIKKRNENKSILKNMTHEELYTSYKYAIEFKDWITQ